MTRRLLLACALAVGVPALAQDMPPPPPADMRTPPPGAGGPGWRPAPHPIARADVPAIVAHAFAGLDADGDGAVSRAEYDAFRTARRARMMARRDGAEAPPSPPGGRETGGTLMTGRGWFETADADRDGRVTPAEAQAAALRLFDRMDGDRDGVISPDERRTFMQAERGRRGPPTRGDAPPQP